MVWASAFHSPPCSATISLFWYFSARYAFAELWLNLALASANKVLVSIVHSYEYLDGYYNIEKYYEPVTVPARVTVPQLFAKLVVSGAVNVIVVAEPELTTRPSGTSSQIV